MYVYTHIIYCTCLVIFAVEPCVFFVRQVHSATNATDPWAHGQPQALGYLWSLRERLRRLALYPLVICYIANWKVTMFHGKTHYVYDNFV